MPSSNDRRSRRNRLFYAVDFKSSLNPKANLKINRTNFVEHPNLPIIAPDFSFVMDLFDMNTLQMQAASIYHGNEERVDEIEEDSEDENADLADEGKDAPPPPHVINRKPSKRIDHGYRYLLVLIDTTSRKVWMYPTKTKNADEVYTAFEQFIGDVQGKIARLLSDSDKAFAKIKANNQHFTYAQVVASHGNHTTLSRIDSFAKTFRQMLYYYYADFVRDGSGEDFSWFDSYELIRDTYNDTKHGALRLIDTKKIKRDKQNEFINADGKVSLHKCNDPKKENQVWHKYYTPNQVWNNAKLRSRIRLQYYLSKRSNYDKIYKKIAAADYVRIRVLNNKVNKGYRKGYFSNSVFKKGKKRGNSWVVNGRYVTYRNILPVGSKEEADAFGAPPKTKLTRAISKKLGQYLKYYNYEPDAPDTDDFIHSDEEDEEVAELLENAKHLQPESEKRVSKPNSRYKDYELEPVKKQEPKKKTKKKTTYKRKKKH
jgi:hypothetical protein